MRPLNRKRGRATVDPAPSRWAWRVERLLLTPAFVLLVRVGLPVLALVAAGLWYVSDPARVEALSEKLAETRAAFETRPEFMVHLLAIDGGNDDLAEEVRAVLPIILPVSSFDLDIVALRAQVEALDPVKSVSLRIRPGGVLQLDLVPREPVLIWRNRKGLALLDAEGVFVRSLEARAKRRDLPVVAGKGADQMVGEALALFDAAAPLGRRVQGLERMGERRWDVVLDRDQRLLLPEDGAVEALERVIALDTAQDILSRDVLRVDLRLGARPTVQMSAFATETRWAIQQTGQ